MKKIALLCLLEIALIPILNAATTNAPPPDMVRLQVKSLTDQEIANYIGWTNQPMQNQICQGYYTEPNLYYQEEYTGPANEGPLHITADRSEFSQTGQSTLSGQVDITQPNREIKADLVYLNRDAKTEKISSIDTYGNVVLREPGNLIIGSKAHFNLTDKSGSLEDVIYRMAFEDGQTQMILPSNPVSETVSILSPNGWGTATKVKRLPSGVVKVYKGTYSACPPTTGGWQLQSNTLTLNRETGRGQATDAILFLHHVPILYLPYFDFPIDNRRKSGFLYPTFGNSTQTGYDIGIPYYFNLAPNYDLTITPDLMTIRGVQLNGVFRYLTPNSVGNIHGSILPNDRAFSDFQSESQAEILGTTLSPSSLQQSELNRLYNASDNRYFFSLKDKHSYNSNWSSYLYVNQVSDDYYFENFSSDPAQIATNQLLNEGDLYYNSEHWRFTGQMQGYQTLHPVNQNPVENQYRKIPELVLAGNYPYFHDDLNFKLNSQYDDFMINPNPGAFETPVKGQRFYLFPDVNISKYWTWGFFNPDLQLAGRQYTLTNQVPGEENDITSVLPILDIDGGLIFDRRGTLFSHPYTQTLEPRIFYLYVPYQNQNDIPLFDTSIVPFSFLQLFQVNRFTGNDRIGDANQVSLAATTRFINDETGVEKARFSVGQIYYFQKRRVNIDTTDLVTLDNEVPPDTYSSPIAAELAYQITHAWNLTGNLAWNPNFVQTNNANILLQYKTDNAHILNLGYNFLRGGDAFIPSNGSFISSDSSKNNLNQTDFSLVWPIASSQWNFIGRWNYNISHSYPQTYFAGLEYDACCWAARFVGGRQFNYLDNNNSPVYNNRFYLQVSLKTLGNVGANNASKLISNVPGYTDNFGAAQHISLPNLNQ